MSSGGKLHVAGGRISGPLISVLLALRAFTFFIGLGRLENIYCNFWVSTESERLQPAVREAPITTGWLRFDVFTVQKLQDRALLKIIRRYFSNV